MCESGFEPAAWDDVTLVHAISGRARAETIAVAQRLACIAEFAERRLGSDLAHARQMMAVDGWASCAAEIAAELTVSTRTASGLMHQGLDLRDRLPLFGALFLRGDITAKVATTASYRTKLILDDTLLANVDADLAKAAARFTGYSDQRLNTAIDDLVGKHDPDAVRRFQLVEKSLDVQFGKPDDDSGTVSVFGRVKVTDAALQNQRMDRLANAVCPNDPRTHGERRTEAFGVIAAGGDHLPCLCGREDCPAPTADDPRGRYFEILVLTDDPDAGAGPESGDGGGPGDGDGGGGGLPDGGRDDRDGGPDSGSHDQPVDGGDDPSASCESDSEPDSVPDDVAVQQDPSADTASRVESDTTSTTSPDPEPAPPAPPTPCPYTSLIAGGGTIPAPLLAELRRMGATVRHVTPASELSAEPRYRPSAALQRFVRARDMTCRFPGCHHPAEYCDLDHTIPYDVSRLTHPGNVKALCRKHHLLKTFWVGRGGWTDEQLADGTVVWTTPAGLRAVVPPGSGLHFPNWHTTTPVPTDTPTVLSPNAVEGRELRMPTRRRTRAQQQLATIKAERERNRRDREEQRGSAA
jgi:hypothetical protein